MSGDIMNEHEFIEAWKQLEALAVELRSLEDRQFEIEGQLRLIALTVFPADDSPITLEEVLQLELNRRNHAKDIEVFAQEKRKIETRIMNIQLEAERVYPRLEMSSGRKLLTKDRETCFYFDTADRKLHILRSKD